MSEEIYKRGAIDGLEAIDRLVITHEIAPEFRYKDKLTIRPAWVASYYNNGQYNSLDMLTRFEGGALKSDIQFVYNELVRDPLEVLDREGRRDRFRLNNRLTLFKRLEIGHELDVERYRMDKKNNFLNGASRLGHKISSDAFVGFALFLKPFISINYHFKEGHWNKTFDEADTVLPFLSDEQVHSGGIYAEHRIANMEISSSISRGSDRKRDANFILWAFESRYWIHEKVKVNVAYEYDVGDSGTAGAGDTQTMSASVDFFF